MAKTNGPSGRSVSKAQSLGFFQFITGYTSNKRQPDWHGLCFVFPMHPAKSEVQAELRPLKPILIVDDDEQVAASISLTLRSAGYDNMRVSCDSRVVPQLLASEDFSLLLLDLIMPHISGTEIIEGSVGLQSRPPILVVTASSHITDYAIGAAGGAIDYLMKPLDRPRFLEAVQRALAHSHSEPIDRLTRNFLLSNRITSASLLHDSLESSGIKHLLEQSGKEYKRLIDSLPTPYVLLEGDNYRVRFSNKAFQRFAGVETHESVNDLPFFDFLDPESRDPALLALLEDGEQRDVELSGCTPGGRKFVIIGAFRCLPHEGYAEASFVDITAHKGVEQQLALVQRTAPMVPA